MFSIFKRKDTLSHNVLTSLINALNLPDNDLEIQVKNLPVYKLLAVLLILMTIIALWNDRANVQLGSGSYLLNSC